MGTTQVESMEREEQNEIHRKSIARLFRRKCPIHIYFIMALSHWKIFNAKMTFK